MTTNNPTSSSAMSADNPPPLALSDIMHPMSPPPLPVDEQQAPVTNSHTMLSRSDRDPSPEPLNDAEILEFWKKLVDMGLATTSDPNDQATLPQISLTLEAATSREKDLMHMILRLSSGPRIDASQLQEQAIAISRLTAQRDYLVSQADEDHAQWASERESWDRTAEALLTQKTRPQKSEDIERLKAFHEAEIKILKDKLHDRQRKLNTLEQEFLRLKPILLMQPEPTNSAKQSNSKSAGKGKQRDDQRSSRSRFTTEALDDIYSNPSSSKMQPPQTNQYPAVNDGAPGVAPSTQHRSGREISGVTKPRKSKTSKAATMFSDAYPEHVLLASQKIGRKRSALVTGLQRAADEALHARDKRRAETHERSSRETAATTHYRPLVGSSSTRSIASKASSGQGAQPKTPKRYPVYGVPAANPYPSGINNPSPSTFVFVNTSPLAHNPDGHAAAMSPSLIGRGTQGTTLSNPPTPLDSLVDAARMMGGSGERSGNERRRPLEEHDTPTAKRRRLSTDTSLKGPKLDRVRSALDVLADQAAAVNESRPSSRPSSSLGTSASTSSVVGSKGKGRASSKDDDPQTSTRSRASSRVIKPSAKKRDVSMEATSASTSTSSRTTTRSRGRKQSVPSSTRPRLIARPSESSVGSRPGDEGSRTEYAGLRPVVGWGAGLPRSDDEDEGANSDSPSISHGPRRIPSPPYIPPVQGPLPTNGYRAYSREFDAAARRPITPLRTPEPPDPMHSPNDDDDDDDHDNRQNVDRNRPATEQHPLAQSMTPYSSTHPIEHSPGTSSHAVSASHPSQQALDPPHPESPLPAQPSKSSANAEQDEDAEGEEDDVDGDGDHVQGDPARTRSPPPPDPPPSGLDRGSSPDRRDGDGDGHTNSPSKETGSDKGQSHPRTQHTLAKSPRESPDHPMSSSRSCTTEIQRPSRPDGQVTLTRTQDSTPLSHPSGQPFEGSNIIAGAMTKKTVLSSSSTLAQDPQDHAVKRSSSLSEFGGSSAPYGVSVPCDSLAQVVC